jgi:hypothetical protein
VVASANRGVRGFSEASEDDESAVPVRAGVRFRAAGRFLSSRSVSVPILSTRLDGFGVLDHGPCPGIV